MTARCHFKMETAFRPRTFGLLTALALAAAASLTAPAPAAATPVTWTFSGSDTFYQNFPFDGQTDTFSGSFVFDTSVLFGNPYSAVNISVSGPLGAGFYTNVLSGNASDIIISQRAFSAMPRFNFAFNLPLNFDDIQATTLFGSTFISGSGAAFTDENAAHSTIVIRRVPEGVPEPASLAILGSALGLFLFARPLSRRRART